jgi:hypothetical protein
MEVSGKLQSLAALPAGQNRREGGLQGLLEKRKISLPCRVTSYHFLNHFGYTYVGNTILYYPSIA